MGLEFHTPKTLCEKWPQGCQFCDLLLCDGKRKTADLNAEKWGITLQSKSGEVIGVQEYFKCNPCIPTMPECDGCEFAKPSTNADSIRAMTDEELAEWVTTVGRTFGEEYEGYMSALDWLKSPVEKESK